MIPAVAFAPLLFVEECFETLRVHFENSPFDAQIEPIAEYFEDTYIGRIRRDGRRRNPRILTIILCIFSLKSQFIIGLFGFFSIF